MEAPMVQLQKFTFKVPGKPDFKVEAITSGAAMGVANNHFGSLPQGCWMDSVIHPNVYSWTEGNFFD